MVLKTFNVQDDVYIRFSKFCKDHGLSMSRQVDMFMESMVGEPEVQKEYLKRLDRIRKGKFIKIKSFADRYGL